MSDSEKAWLEWWTGGAAGDQYQRDVDAHNKRADAENARMQQKDEAAAAKRADLIDELAEVMNDRNDMDVGFQQFAAAVVEFLEKRGLLKPGD